MTLKILAKINQNTEHEMLKVIHFS